MLEIENLCQLNDRMSNNYNKLETLMANLYTQMETGETIDTKELLLSLGEIGMHLLDTQRDFVESYGNEHKTAQEIMCNKIDEKAQALFAAQDQLRGRSY